MLGLYPRRSATSMAPTEQHAIDDAVRVGAVADEVAEHERLLVVGERGPDRHPASIVLASEHPHHVPGEHRRARRFVVCQSR